MVIIKQFIVTCNTRIMIVIIPWDLNPLVPTWKTQAKTVPQSICSRTRYTSLIATRTCIIEIKKSIFKGAFRFLSITPPIQKKIWCTPVPARATPKSWRSQPKLRATQPSCIILTAAALAWSHDSRIKMIRTWSAASNTDYPKSFPRANWWQIGRRNSMKLMSCALLRGVCFCLIRRELRWARDRTTKADSKLFSQNRSSCRISPQCWSNQLSRIYLT